MSTNTTMPSQMGSPSDNQAPNIYACAITTVVIAGIAVAARFYARARILRVVGIEDWCILIALVGPGLAARSFRRARLSDNHLPSLHRTVAVDRNLRLHDQRCELGSRLLHCLCSVWARRGI
jgi:hypothetical protein